jgi:hypothetical protein
MVFAFIGREAIDVAMNDRLRRVLLTPVRPGDGLLSELIAGAQVGRRELVFMPP